MSQTNQGATSRKFRLGIGVRSFQAGRRLSVNLASVSVQVKLPVGLVGSNRKSESSLQIAVTSGLS